MTSRKAGALHLRDWGGAGARVLLTHGLAAHTHWWDPVVPHWKGLFHAAALDFRGHGDSDWLEESYTTSAWVDDIEAARRALGWDRFILVGHSMGARIALGYAGAHGDRLRGVCAIDFLTDFHREVRRHRTAARARPAYPDEDAILSKFRLQPPGTLLGPDALREVGRHGITKTPEGWSWKFDWRTFSFPYGPVWPELEPVKAEALIVRGEHSTIMSREDMDKVAAALAHGRAAEIAGAHHHVPLDKPAELAAAVAAWAAALPA